MKRGEFLKKLFFGAAIVSAAPIIAKSALEEDEVVGAKEYFLRNRYYPRTPDEAFISTHVTKDGNNNIYSGDFNPNGVLYGEDGDTYYHDGTADVYTCLGGKEWTCILSGYKMEKMYKSIKNWK